MKRYLYLTVVLVVCFALPAFVSAASDTPGVTDDEVAIGMTCPMSGPAALWSAM